MHQVHRSPRSIDRRYGAPSHRVGRWRSWLPVFAVFAWLVAWQAQAQCTTQNLARTGVASASSTYVGYSPARTNDGDRSTALGGASSWANARETATTPALPATLEIALAAPAAVDRIVLYTTAGYEIRDYDLQYFDGAGWRALMSVRGNTLVQRDHRFAATGMSRVRLVGLSGPNLQTVHVRVNELEVCAATQALGTVRGQVSLFRSGMPPVANALVDIGGGRTTLTDANGNYVFANVPAGTYQTRITRAGLTCGSAQFQRDNYTVTLPSGGTTNTSATCYDRNPIVYAHGWTDATARFRPVLDTLRGDGYLDVDGGVQSTILFTPPLQVNAANVARAIDQARYVTGQPKAILFGHSMGGLVVRSYVESMLYRGDVSQVFTFGSPHRGVPLLTQLACVPTQPAVCQMSKPSMLLFNLIHGQRPGVGYHVVAGDAPMWRLQPICFRIFGRRICIGSIPLPDFTYRNFGGWAMGLLIPFGDDALIQSYSSGGMPGFIDRFGTQEVHINPQLGHRDYFDWGGLSLSQQAYGQCVQPVLVARSRANCGTVSFQPPFLFFLKQQMAAAATRAGAVEYAQRSRRDRVSLSAFQRIEREVLVDGSPTIFSAQWTAGSARVTLVDPSGRTFDPAYAASILDGDPLPGEPVTDQADPDMVLYEADATGAAYQLPAPRPGRWRMIVEAAADVPANTALDTNVAFASDLGMTFANDFPFYLVGDRSPIRVTPTQPLLSGQAQATVTRADGVSDSVALVRQLDGSFLGTYAVPDATGIAEVSWFVTGTDASGRPFERAGADAVQIGKRNLVVTGVGVETVVPSPQDPRRSIGLDVPVSLQSEFDGAATVAADLIDGAGNVVANAALGVNVATGGNRVTLRFAGDDLYLNARNGPYRVTNLITTDERRDTLLSDWRYDQLTTAAYDYRIFGPPSPVACGSVNLMRSATASASSTYAGYSPARTNDGDRNPALGEAYSWANARETPTTPALPASLDLALPAPAIVEQVIVTTTAGYEIRDYDLQYFDGAQWTTIAEVRGNVETVREHRIPPTSLSRLRIVGLSGPDVQTVHVRINEVEAYRCDLAVAVAAPVTTAKAASPWMPWRWSLRSR